MLTKFMNKNASFILSRCQQQTPTFWVSYIHCCSIMSILIFKLGNIVIHYIKFHSWDICCSKHFDHLQTILEIKVLQKYLWNSSETWCIIWQIFKLGSSFRGLLNWISYQLISYKRRVEQQYLNQWQKQGIGERYQFFFCLISRGFTITVRLISADEVRACNVAVEVCCLLCWWMFQGSIPTINTNQ